MKMILKHRFAIHSMIFSILISVFLVGCSLSDPTKSDTESPLENDRSFVVLRNVSNIYNILSKGYKISDKCGQFRIESDSPSNISVIVSGFLAPDARTFQFIASATDNVKPGPQQVVLRGRNSCGNQFNTYMIFDIR